MCFIYRKKIKTVKKNSINTRKKNNMIFGLIITSPAILTIGCLYIFPVFYSFYLSFTDFNFFRASEVKIIGFKNYIDSLISNDFIYSLKLTCTISFFSVVFEFLFGMLLAVMIYKISKRKEFFRTLLLIPMMIAPVVVGLMFRFMLNSEFGIVNTILMHIGLIKEPIGWLISGGMAKVCIIILDIWATTPLMFLLLYAGLTMIPPELYEAAKVDGANDWQSFYKITLPLIKKIALLAILIRFMDVFRVFDSIYILTKGGPGKATESLSLLIYRTNWINYDVGRASSLSFIMVFIMLVVASVIIWLSKDHSENKKQMMV